MSPFMMAFAYPSAIISCPQTSPHTIKIPNYSLSSCLHLHNFAYTLSSSTLLSELWPILQHMGQIYPSFQSFPDASRQYYLLPPLHPQNTRGVPLTWGLIFHFVRMSWYILRWWAQVVGTILISLWVSLVSLGPSIFSCLPSKIFCY